MDRDEKVNLIAKSVAEGGWSSIHSVVDLLTDKQLEYWYDLWDEDEDQIDDGYEPE